MKARMVFLAACTGLFAFASANAALAETKPLPKSGTYTGSTTVNSGTGVVKNTKPLNPVKQKSNQPIPGIDVVVKKKHS